MTGVTVTRTKFSMTPGFTEALEAVQGRVNVLGLAAALHTAAPGEPSWVIGDPDTPSGQAVKEDEGRTLRMAGRFKFYAIRDDHPEDCDCGCGGGSIVTFLLPSEY